MATETELTEARAALHKLMTGKQVASYSVEGQSVTVNAAGIEELERYIEDLENQLSVSGSSGAKRRPFGVAF